LEQVLGAAIAVEGAGGVTEIREVGIALEVADAKVAGG
jgi:hypothetical protein